MLDEKNKPTLDPMVEDDSAEEKTLSAADIAGFLEVAVEDEADEAPEPKTKKAEDVEAEDVEAEDDSDDSVESDEDESSEEVVEEAEAEPAPQEDAGKVTFTPAQQAFFEAALADRLSRDRKTKGVRELEALTGQDLEAVLADLRQQRIDQATTDYGMTEDEARRHVESEERVRLLEAEKAQAEAERDRLAASTKYREAKARSASNPRARPYIQRYEREVEALTQGGKVLDYETGLKYVIGDKFLAGELQDYVADATEKRTLANVAKRSKTRVEGGGQSPRAPESRLGGTERDFARILLDDVTDKPELAYSKAKPKKG